jgi:hypothetical protein
MGENEVLKILKCHIFKVSAIRDFKFPYFNDSFRAFIQHLIRFTGEKIAK